MIKTGRCHYGAIEFNVILPEVISDLFRCNCSLCAKRGAVLIPVDDHHFTVLKGENRLTLYQFHTRTAEHYFCSQCGIYTHHRMRSHPDRFAVNAACLKKLTLPERYFVRQVDGANHASDRIM